MGRAAVTDKAAAMGKVAVTIKVAAMMRAAVTITAMIMMTITPLVMITVKAADVVLGRNIGADKRPHSRARDMAGHSKIAF